MMRFPVLVGLFFAITGSVNADPYLLFKEKDKIGIKDDAGKVVIPASFDALGWSDGSFSVVSGVTGYKLNDHWGIINLKKEFITKAEYESITWSGADRFIVQKKISPVRSATGCLDLKGNVAIPFLYDGIKITGLRAVVFLRESSGYRYGLTDLNGHPLIPLKYYSVHPLGTLRYAVENNLHKTALYDDGGKAETGFTIDSISSFKGSYAVFYENLLQGLISREGQIEANAKFIEIKSNADGSFTGRLPDEWKVLSGENKELRRTDADQLVPLSKNLYHITRRNLHGMVDRDFKIILPIEYDYIGTLTNGKIVASRNGKYGITSLNGTAVLPFEFDSVVMEGRVARVRTDRYGKSTWALYDTVAVRKTAKEFDFIGPFNGSFFPALKNNYWGAVDRYGKETLQCVYDSLIQVDGDKIAVRFMGQYGIVSTEEKWVLPPQPYRALPIHGDRFWIRHDSTLFIKNLEGADIYFTKNQVVFGPAFMLETSKDGSSRQIDYDGRIVERSAPVLVQQTEKIFPESEGLRGIRKDDKFGFVDERGRLRIANRYDGIGLFHEGKAAVKILTKWGYINRAEQIIVQPVFESAEEFHNGRARVSRNGKFGMVDGEGKLVLPTRYDSITLLADGYYLLRVGKFVGLGDANGQLIVDTRYDRLENLQNGYVLIQRDGKFGLLTIQSMSTIPLQYDQLIYDKDRNEYLGLLKSSWMRIKVTVN